MLLYKENKIRRRCSNIHTNTIARENLCDCYPTTELPRFGRPVGGGKRPYIVSLVIITYVPSCFLITIFMVTIVLTHINNNIVHNISNKIQYRCYQYYYDHHHVYLRTTTLRTVAALASLILRLRTTRQLLTKRCRCRSRSLPAKATRRSSARR